MTQKRAYQKSPTGRPNSKGEGRGAAAKAGAEKKGGLKWGTINRHPPAQPRNTKKKDGAPGDRGRAHLKLSAPFPLQEETNKGFVGGNQ